jgi:prophage antirepressor-like protein
MSQDFKTLANPFQFADLDVRTATDEHGEVWFCAKDVCAALDISWSSMTLENMPDNWKGVIKLITPGGEQSANFINEAGLYHLIFRSNKPKAKEFANWVCETVLPEIRKTGFFGAIEIKDQISISKQIAALAAQITDTKNAFQRRLLMDQLRRLCNLVNQPIPPTDWLALNHDQVDLFLSNGGAV